MGSNYRVRRSMVSGVVMSAPLLTARSLPARCWQRRRINRIDVDTMAQATARAHQSRDCRRQSRLHRDTADPRHEASACRWPNCAAHGVECFAHACSGAQSSTPNPYHQTSANRHVRMFARHLRERAQPRYSRFQHGGYPPAAERLARASRQASRPPWRPRVGRAGRGRCSARRSSVRGCLW
jgi:hypothetical protein